MEERTSKTCLKDISLDPVFSPTPRLPIINAPPPQAEPSRGWYLFGLTPVSTRTTMTKSPVEGNLQPHHFMGQEKENQSMSLTGEPIADLDSPQLMIDLDVLDVNLERMRRLSTDNG